VLPIGGSFVLSRCYTHKIGFFVVPLRHRHRIRWR